MNFLSPVDNTETLKIDLLFYTDHDVCVCVGRGKLCLSLCVYLRVWCVLAH